MVRTVAVTGAEGVQKLVTTDAAGHGCDMLAPGQYTAKVQLTSQQEQHGIR